MLFGDGAAEPLAVRDRKPSPGRGRWVAGLLMAAHPVPAFTVTVLITVLAAASGYTRAGCLLVAAAVLAGQLSVGWSNDRVDMRRDITAGRRDKPLATGRVRAGTVSAAAGCALAASVPLSLANGTEAGGAHLTAVAAAWCYNLGVKRTAASWLPYVIGFGLLPAFVTLGLPGHPWPAPWVVAAGALLGVGAHFTNVLPDIEVDLAAGVRGLPQRLGHRWAGMLAVVPLLGASVALVLGPSGEVGPAGWGALAVTVSLALGAAVLPAIARGRRRHDRAPFLVALAIAAVDVALLLLRGTALT